MDGYETPEVTYLSAQTLSSVRASTSGGGTTGGSTGGSTGGFPLGTINNPCDLTNIGSKTVTASEYYFKCKVAGAVDFSIETSGILSEVKIYNTIISLPNLLIDVSEEEFIDNESSYSTTMSNANINTGSINYLVYVKVNTKVTITCTIKQHLDEYTVVYSPGIVWKTVGGGRPSYAILYKYCIYLNLDMVYVFNGLIVYMNALNLHTKLKEVLLTVSEFVAGFIPLTDVLSGIASGADFVMSILGICIDVFPKIMDKDKFLEEFWSAAGLNGIEEQTGKPVFTSGVCIKIFAPTQNMSTEPTGFDEYEFSSWNSNKIEGIPGYTGSWNFYNAKTLKSLIEDSLNEDVLG